MICSTDSIGFPDLLGCQSSLDTIFTLYNTGDIDISLTSFDPQPVFTSTVSLPVTIKSGDSIIFPVKFTPQANGHYSG